MDRSRKRFPRHAWHIIAFLLSFPFALYYEGPGFMAAWKASTAVVGAPWLIRQMALDGFYYYAYNEVAFITLNQVAPVTHSIANTFKRVAIILATVLVFGNKLSTLGAIGSGIALHPGARYTLVPTPRSPHDTPPSPPWKAAI